MNQNTDAPAASQSTRIGLDELPRTRLAPSPTGALHLGNARTFLINWMLARQQGWQIVLRIDDLDGPRIKRGADRDAMDVLQWLGLDWDEGPYYQTHSLSRYQSARQQLGTQGTIYPCRCTRTQIQDAALSAPHAADHELRYPGTCRPAQPQAVTGSQSASPDDPVAWRLRVEPGAVQRFHDEWHGAQAVDVDAEVGDFLVATKLGLPSYQLAVVVDDEAERINRIVRGDDLLTSTARQALIRAALGYHRSCQYWHLPLVVGPDGRRLAKRHGDSRVAHYRDRGVSPERLLGLLAEWCGIAPRRERSLTEVCAEFRLENVPPQPIVFTPDDDAWLLGRVSS